MRLFDTTLMILLIATTIGISSMTSKYIQHSKAVRVVEEYTGETYHSEDCENLDLYESDNDTVTQACETLEGEG